jgi:ribosomal protection tetracycline resistance protein
VPFLNLGIVAHVDAGKTSLTERLLYRGGVIDALGSVDAGSTQTDSLALERRRGITIKTAVASFPLGDVTVNLIDTPGHPDFIAEVERALRVLDGAILVISAVEGVQPQTRVLMRTLCRLRVPTLLFVNKIDRAGAREGDLLADLAARLTPDVVAVSTVHGLGTRGATAHPRGPGDAGLAARLVDVSGDEALLASFVRDERSVPYGRLREALAERTRTARLYPVFFGSAVTGAGIDDLVAALPGLLPASAGSPEGPARGTVFKVERSPAGARVAYVRMFAGTLRVRDRVPLPSGPAVVTGIEAFDGGPAVRAAEVTAGQIAKVHGLHTARIGDPVGSHGRPRRHPPAPPAPKTVDPSGREDGRLFVPSGPEVVGASGRGDGHLFAPPTLETVVVPRRGGDGRALRAALVELADQDPLIGLRADGSVLLYGEVQKEVIEATLAEEYGIAVVFRESTTIHVERPAGVGRAGATIGEDGNPYQATLDLVVSPAPAGSGVSFGLDVPIEQVPIHVFRTGEAFRDALGQAVRQALAEGLYGWRVTDVRVDVPRTGFVSPATTAGDFRKLVPLVLAEALRAAGTVVCEPIHRFALDGPAGTLGPMLGALGRFGAIPETYDVRGASYAIDGLMPAARLRDLESALPGLSHGEGVLETTFDGYRPVPPPFPRRPRAEAAPAARRTPLPG